MPPGSKVRSRKRRAVACRPDRLSALSDTALQRVLSFLPSREAVQTCVLSSRWRHVWKSVQALRVTDVDGYRSALYLNKFINSFLLLRDPLPLHEVQFGSHQDGEDSDDDEPLQYMELWLRQGLSSEAGVLRVYSNYSERRWTLRDGLITSKDLMVLELHHVDFDSLLLDFSSCPALEDLRMKFCYFKASTIMSSSVKRLSITCSDFEIRSQISAPNLIFLELADCCGRTPLLEHMPLLTSAFVRLRRDMDDYHNCETGDCGSCEECCDSNIGSNTSVLLEALSGSTNLELTSLASKFIFRKDLTRCPVFSKLKTSLVSEWCMTANLGALICFLKHSPVLEKLTLQFPEILEDLVGTEASYSTVKEPFSLEHLTVEVKCQNADDKRIHKVIELLDFYGVPSEQINIQKLPKLIELEGGYKNTQPSLSFSFDQET